MEPLFQETKTKIETPQQVQFISLLPGGSVYVMLGSRTAVYNPFTYRIIAYLKNAAPLSGRYHQKEEIVVALSDRKLFILETARRFLLKRAINIVGIHLWSL